MDTPRWILLGLVVTAGVAAAWMAGQQPSVESPVIVQDALRIRLVDASGAPMTCRATLWRLGDGQRQLWPGAGGMCEDGWLAWRELEPGGYRLMAQIPGRVLVDRELEVGREPIDLGEVAPPVGGVLRGVVTSDGVPVQGAVLALEGGRRHSESGPDGTFAFPGVAMGATQVRAALGSRGAVKHVEVGAGEPVEISLELEELPERGVVGLRFEMEVGGARILDIHPRGPGADLLVVGDVVEQIEGTMLAGLSRQDVLGLLSGEPGQKLTLLVRRKAELRSVGLVRVPHSSL